MDRSLARFSLAIATGSALCLCFPIREGRALAAALAAKDSAKAKQAQQFYKEGQYEDAAKIFTELSGEYPDRGKNIAEKDRPEGEGWIAEMEKLRDQTAAAAVVAAPPATITPAPAPVTPPPAAAPPMPPAPVTAPAVAAVETVPSSPDSPTAGHGMRIAGIACGAVGLASVGTAIYFYTRATSLSDTDRKSVV